MMERFSVNVSQSICNSVEQVSKFGKSVLFTKETGELCKRNWFKNIAIEMSEKCPELFQVLFSAIGRLLSLDVMGKNIHFMFLFLLKYVLAVF